MSPRKAKIPTLGWSSGNKPFASFEIYSVYDVIDVVRKNPAVFIGGRTLTGLFHYVDGYRSGLGSIGIGLSDGEPPLFEFHEWVRKRLRSEVSRGWLWHVLDVTGGDEEAAYDRFFIELDYYRQGVRA